MGGQCLECPQQAASPSMLCRDCQLRARAAGEPLPASGVQRVQGVFGALLETFSGRERQHLKRNLDTLCAQLRAGQVAGVALSKLLAAADAVDAGDYPRAHKEVTAIATRHWDQHKDWLPSLRRL